MRLLTDFVLVTGLIITIIIVFTLFKAKNKALPQKILISFFTILFLCFVNAYADLHELSLLYIFTFILDDCAGLYAGPLLYIYVKSLFQAQKGLIKKNLWHFIPTLVYLIFISIPLCYNLSFNTTSFDYIETIKNEFSFLWFLPSNLIFIIYNILSINLLNKHTKKVKLNYSNLDKANPKWVYIFLWGLLLASAISLTASVYEIGLGYTVLVIDYITYYLLVALVVYLAYYGVSQSGISLPDFIKNDSISEGIENKAGNTAAILHHLSNATSEEIETLRNRLKEVLEKEKPYLDEDLTLGRLAQLIPTSDKKLSALLNHKIEITFYDLINSYRVEEVKTKMNNKDYSNYTLLAIGFDSGFKSKSSFNRIFKKTTGFSPSEFKKSHLKQVSNKPLSLF